MQYMYKQNGPVPVVSVAQQSNQYPGYDNVVRNNNSVQNNSYKNRLIQIIIDLLIIVIIFVAFIIVYTKLPPRIRYFHCSETDIFFPNLPDTIPFYAVGLYGTIGPILIIFIIEALNASIFPLQKNKTNDRWSVFGKCFYHAISLFILGIGMTLLITEIGKRWIGRLRPHFIAVCNPNMNSIQCQTANGIYNTIDTGGSFCTGNPSEVEDSRLSFPSGHSSYATYTMLYLIIYLQARVVFYKLRFIKPLLQVTAFIAAFVTCISRISDYHHRGSDVLGGIAVGAVIAIFITLVVSRVLWYLKAKKDYYDFDLKPVNY